MQDIYDVIAIGGGPGGYTAALYAARAGLKVLVLEKLSAGGQMASTANIDNYPGFAEGIDGFVLAEAMQRQAERFGARTELAQVLSVSLNTDIKQVQTSRGLFYGKTVILATGADPRQLGLGGEREYVGRGVHYCASCDGMFYRGKTVVVVGGGNSAVADALTLSRLAKKVLLVHRRDTLRATKAEQIKLEAASNVEFVWQSEVTRLLTESKLTGVMLRDVQTGEQTQVACDGIFISIGREPVSALVHGQLKLDDKGYVLADETTQTSLSGVYAVGDVRTKQVRQIVTAVADGAVAVHYAQQYLAKMETETG